jgi:Asp-tRNA(Asn)/Glu-tRNA(Gln) amidotransferase A subunit family amidase
MKTNAEMGEISSGSEEDLCFTPALELRDMIRKKSISPVEVSKAFLHRIERINSMINAYCTVVPDSALQSARKAEDAIMRGHEIGPLHGVPVSIKDNTVTRGIRTTFGSKLHEDYIPDSDALVVERLKKAGAIILGKTNLSEFGAGASTFNRVFGPTLNPWDTRCNSGGSSGGAAAAVSAGLGPLAQGTDLGGSVRIPASFCGVVGLRPSPGRVPRYPNLLSWDTLAVEGVIARTIGDAALMLDAVSGPDEGIPISLARHETEFLGAVRNPTIKGSRIAWSDNLNIMPIDTEILEVARSTMGVFHGLGCEVVEDAPDFSGVRETALTLRGLRYVSLYQDQFDDPRFKKLVNPLVIGNIEEGLKLSLRDIARAERHRSELWQRVNNFFEKYDFLLTPTVAIPPFPAETIYPTEINGKPMEHYVDWIMLTYAITITCLPALSVPCGWTKGGLPVGLQIVGRRHGESRVLRAAAAYEAAAPWADKRPPLGQ